MKHVPIATAKDRLSEFVASVEGGGEEVVITRHGVPAAKLVPVQESKEARQARARAAMERLAEMRATMRAEGRTATIEEMIEWKNEGRR